MTSDKHYSLLKLFTGFINAALIAWKLIVVKAISIAKTPSCDNDRMQCQAFCFQ